MEQPASSKINTRQNASTGESLQSIVREMCICVCVGKRREGVRKGYGGEGRGRLYTYPYTVTTRMTPALRWAAMSAISMFRSANHIF